MGTCRCFVREVRCQQADFLPRLPLVSTRETTRIEQSRPPSVLRRLADQQRNTISVLANQIKS
jgi:hypothetical protein